MKAIVEERRRKGGDLNTRGDFLDVLLSTTELSEEEKISFVLDSLLGGYETTSLLISMAIYFLAQSTKSLEKLKVHLFFIFSRCLSFFNLVTKLRIVYLFIFSE